MQPQMINPQQPQMVMNPASFVEKAMARREARLEKSTLKEVETLEDMKEKGVMSPIEADALKTLALASLQIDKNTIKPMMPANYPQTQPIANQT